MRWQRVDVPRYATLQEIHAAGLNVRLWCCWCCRAVTVELLREPNLWKAQIVPLARLQALLICKECRSRDALILPASKPKPPERDRTWQQEVEHWFFNVRPTYKMRKRR